ncbi:hypothetical protein AB0C96_31685 [Streptomyces sp. NPDC048506]|uniref:hypothetical protein n=1 Tax=Streptomyces sp. NPDC048506 TaxID=3155028 RepID=UPI00343EBE3F
MTANARTDSRAALETLHDLRCAFADAQMRLPEMMLAETADGDIRINLGRVGVGTAARLVRIVNDRKRVRRRRVRATLYGWGVGSLLALCAGPALLVVAVIVLTNS